MFLKENLSVKHLVKEIWQQAGVTKHKHFLCLPPTQQRPLQNSNSQAEMFWENLWLWKFTYWQPGKSSSSVLVRNFS